MTVPRPPRFGLILVPQSTLCSVRRAHFVVVDQRVGPTRRTRRPAAPPRPVLGGAVGLQPLHAGFVRRGSPGLSVWPMVRCGCVKDLPTAASKICCGRPRQRVSRPSSPALTGGRDPPGRQRRAERWDDRYRRLPLAIDVDGPVSIVRSPSGKSRPGAPCRRSGRRCVLNRGPFIGDGVFAAGSGAAPTYRPSAGLGTMVT